MKWLIFVLLAISLIVIVIIGFKFMPVLQESGPQAEQNNQAIKVAVRELQQRNLSVEGYDISVVKRRESIIVLFTPPAQEVGSRGSKPGQLGFEVEVTEDLRAIRVSAVR